MSLVRCPMCDYACMAIAYEGGIAFFCANDDCVADGVVYRPDDFDFDAWLADWGTRP